MSGAEAPILVVGADGLIGSSLSTRLRERGYEVWETTRRRTTVGERRVFLDLADNASAWRPPCRFSCVYLCAAVPSMEQCRQDPQGTFRINVTHTVQLAELLGTTDAFVVFPSSSSVFDGSSPFRREEEAVGPVTEYGRQKAEAENKLSRLGYPSAIARLTKIVSPGMRLFRQWITTLREGGTITPFYDMFFAPISLRYACDVLVEIGQTRRSGITHVPSSEDISYAQAAAHFANRLGVPSRCVKAIPAQQAGLDLAAVPRYSSLASTRYTSTLRAPDPWSALDSVMGH